MHSTLISASVQPERKRMYYPERLKDISTPDFSTMNFPTPDFSTPDFSTMNFSTQCMVQKSGVGKFMVEKSGVEMSFNRSQSLEKIFYCWSEQFMKQNTIS